MTMADSKRFDAKKQEVAKLRSLRDQSTQRRDQLERNSLESAQEAVQARVDLILGKPRVEDNDINDLVDLENDLAEKIKEEREVQALEREFQTIKQNFVGRPFRRK